jgi:integrase
MQDATAEAPRRRKAERTTITLRAVESLQPGEVITDDKITGFTAKRQPNGRIAYGLRYVTAAGKQRWLGLGIGIAPSRARELAEKRRGDVADGKDPVAERKAARKARAHTVAALLDDHLRLYVRGTAKLRSADEIERVFEVYIKPEIGKTPVIDLRRSEVVKMLDKVAKVHGLVMADRVLAHLRKALTWHAARDDRFNSPIIRGMARTKPAQRARKRVLDDQEIRDLWKALDTAKVPSCFPTLVRFLLLSARRRGEAAAMQWQDIEGDVWIIRGEAHKTGDDAGDMAIPIAPSMRGQMGKARRRGFVFSTVEDATKAFDGFGKAKAALDKAIGKLRKADGRDPMPGWTIHDLRRTARSLMSRAGVPSKHAELALGHTLKGVERTYDRHEYLAERRDALEKLAKLIERILAGKPQRSEAGEVDGNVVRLPIAAA